MKRNMTNNYRICEDEEETMNHIASGCPAPAKTDYIHRHDETLGLIYTQSYTNTVNVFFFFLKNM